MQSQGPPRSKATPTEPYGARPRNGDPELERVVGEEQSCLARVLRQLRQASSRPPSSQGAADYDREMLELRDEIAPKNIVMIGAIAYIAKVMYIPKAYLLSAVLVFCVIGSYALGNRFFDVWVMLVFGLIGFGLEYCKVPLGPFVIGFVLASIILSILHATLAGGPELVDATIKGSTKTLRGWFFCLAFVSIGLDTNFRELSRYLKGGKPLILYLCGQTLNLCLTLFMAWLMFRVVFTDFVETLVP